MEIPPQASPPPAGLQRNIESNFRSFTVADCYGGSPPPSEQQLGMLIGRLPFR